MYDRAVAVEPERPTFPWARVVVTVAVVILALSAVGWIVHTVWRLVKLAAILVVLVALVWWAIGSRADRRSQSSEP